MEATWVVKKLIFVFYKEDTRPPKLGNAAFVFML
jgi:hypothetical protein